MSISLVHQRVLHGNTEISSFVNDYRSGNYAFSYTPGQYLYIGVNAPFTNIYFNLPTPSVTNSGLAVVEIWYNKSWDQAVDKIDSTNGMQADGRLSWNIEDDDGGWDLEQFSSTVGLVNPDIYYRYWVRISWPNAFTCSLNYMGQKFSNDLSLATTNPDLVVNNKLLLGFKPGKTSWDEQHFAAAEYIFRDLKKRKMVEDPGQLYDWQTFEDASCAKVAEIVYSAFGAAYRDYVKEAVLKYEAEMKKIFNLDTSKDGKLQDFEKNDVQGWMTR